MPKEPNGRSPSKLFYGVTSDHSELKSVKVWGCPTCVLDPCLQGRKKISKWEPCSQPGQFVGRSSLDSSSVGSIHNITNGKISSQFHTGYETTSLPYMLSLPPTPHQSLKNGKLYLPTNVSISLTQLICPLFILLLHFYSLF